jgi:AcrR family transcriptional regulator/acyl-coenzyme A thioesterase PaaI-like protein
MAKRRSSERTTKTAIPRPKKSGMTRADKLAATRRKLMTAVTEIVGEEGYGNASVAKITARARVAQGTFYNYFKSQQDLFDQLLPELGTQLLDRIRSRVADHPEGLKREEIGFRAFFEFLADTPEFYRILNEAETISPKAFRDHMSNMIQGYLRALRRSQEQGGLPGYSADELEVVVCILLGARNYLSYHYMVCAGHVGPAPEWMVRAYMKFVTGGLLYGGTSGPTYRPKRLTVGESNGTTRVEGRRVIAVGNSGAVLELSVQDGDRDPTGLLRYGVLLDLASSVAELAAGSERPPVPTLLNLAISMLAPTRARRLVATARCQRRGDAAVLHVGVAIHEDRSDGAAVMTGQATFVA